MQRHRILVKNNAVVVGSLGCWLWAGKTHYRGYGTAGVATYGDRYAHRASYRAFHGDIPEGAYVMHVCDNRLCVNPEHLVAGTQADNLADMRMKGRGLRGERASTAKLTREAVVKIRECVAKGMTQQSVAARFGISRPHVSGISRRVFWKHV